MRLLSPTLAATLFTLGLGASTSFAQDCPPCPACPESAARADVQGPTLEIDDDDDKVFGELEARLNEVLLVDESGQIVLRKEFSEGLPFPAERVQAMLGSFVELGKDGKIHLRDREAVRPYLPMIRRFLSPESMERMRQLQTLPPEQRREAMRRMLGPGGEGEAPRGEAPRGEAPRPARPERPTPAPEGERPRPRDDGRGADGRAPGAGPERLRAIEERLAEIERSTKRIERMLEEAMREHGFDRGGERGRDRQPRRDRDRGGRRWGGIGGDLMERAQVWGRGLRKLREVTEPEDMEAIGRALGRLRENLEPGDLRDRGALMQKLQDSVEPQDVGRLMEVFSEFLGTPEGRAMAEEVERLVQRIEEMVSSQEGDRMGETLERLEGLLGRQGDGKGGLREQLERLIQPRERAQGGERRERREGGERREGEERLHRGDRESPAPGGKRPDGARLY